MAIQRISIAPDDPRLFVVRRDVSGGTNNRQHASNLLENQVESIYNADIGVPGITTKRPGSVLIANDIGADAPVALHNFECSGGTNYLAMYEHTHLHVWQGTGDWTAWKTDFTASTDVGIVTCKMSGIAPDDVILVQNGAEQFVFKNDGTAIDISGGANPPQVTTVMCWYGNRVWTLKNDILEYSDAYPADYGTAFNNAEFRIPVGEERFLLGTRDLGIVAGGSNAIWSIAPSATPAATDIPQPLVPMGVVSKKAAVVYADDIYFFSFDGFRGLKRTVQDKLQSGASFPLSYGLKTEFERISWAYISRLSMVAFDNKIFITVPTGAATNDTWVYYPAFNSFSIIQGWSPRCFGTFKVSGEERLYYGKIGDGDVYRGWYGYTDEGTTTSDGVAVNYTEVGRKEDLGQPLKDKVGGTLEIKAKRAGDYSVDVYVSFDEMDFNYLGTVDLDISLIVFPVSFPVRFDNESIINQKFHLDAYGPWRMAQVKLVHDETNTADIIIYERNITSYLNEIEDE